MSLGGERLIEGELMVDGEGARAVFSVQCSVDARWVARVFGDGRVRVRL